MRIYERQINTKWYKAAIIGSTWASFEIIFGSFLHNIRFPMSGTILTFVAILLVISFTQVWKERGIVLRAGIVAALMKSISPSAILLGPMTGIFAEALFLEIGLSLLGRNWLGYVLGSILAMYSVFLHKIVTLLFLYGFDIVKISENFYKFIIKMLGLRGVSFLQAMLILSFFYILMGLIASIWGIFLGKKLVKSNNQIIENSNSSPNNQKIETTESTSAINIFFHLAALVGILVALNVLTIPISAVISAAYLSFCLIKYKNTRRFFLKWGFWFQIVVIMSLSVLFYNGTQNFNLMQKEGLNAGLVMIMRMLVVIVSFGSLSVEMRNPFIKALLYRKGFGNLYYSMTLAFSVLPLFVEKTTNFKYFVRHPFSILSSLVATAQSIYVQFVSQIQYRQIVIVTGEVRQGKTTFLLNTIQNLKKSEIDLCGILAIGQNLNDKRIGFFAMNLQNDEKKLLASIEPIGNLKIGRFYFDEKIISYFTDTLTKNEISQVLVIDEVGNLELQNNGWHKLISEKFNQNNQLQVWAVRKKFLKDILRKYHINKAYIFELGKDKEIEAENLISSLANIPINS